MGDRCAERAGGGALGVDVDPLRVVGRLGETVDALLLDLAPRRRASSSPTRSRITIGSPMRPTCSRSRRRGGRPGRPARARRHGGTVEGEQGVDAAHVASIVEIRAPSACRARRRSPRASSASCGCCRGTQCRPGRRPHSASAPRAAAAKFARLTAARPSFIWAGSATSRKWRRAATESSEAGSTEPPGRHLHLQRERPVGDRVRAEQLVPVRPASAARPRRRRRS